jgi:AcrR family transcriptional regulator
MIEKLFPGPLSPELFDYLVSSLRAGEGRRLCDAVWRAVPPPPPTLTRQGTRDRLLAEGWRLFSERGFEATSVRDITAAAGANLAAVSYHFGGKDKLLAAVRAAAAQPDLPAQQAPEGTLTRDPN